MTDCDPAMTQPEHVLCGRYVFFKEEDIDTYLQGIGVGLIFRKTISITKPKLELTHNPATGEWLLKHDTVFYSYKLAFKIGEEVANDETFDNRPCRTTVSWDETKKDVLIFNQVVTDGDNVKSTLERLPDSTVKLVRFCGPHRCAEYFKLASDIAGGDFVEGQTPSMTSTSTTSTNETVETDETEEMFDE